MLDFPINLNSAANIPVPNLYGFGVLSAPYGDIRGQSRSVPVPEIHDVFNWAKGNITSNLAAIRTEPRSYTKKTINLEPLEIGAVIVAAIAIILYLNYHQEKQGGKSG